MDLLWRLGLGRLLAGLAGHLAVLGHALHVLGVHGPSLPGVGRLLGMMGPLLKALQALLETLLEAGLMALLLGLVSLLCLVLLYSVLLGQCWREPPRLTEMVKLLRAHLHAHGKVGHVTPALHIEGLLGHHVPSLLLLLKELLLPHGVDGIGVVLNYKGSESAQVCHWGSGQDDA